MRGSRSKAGLRPGAIPEPGRDVRRTRGHRPPREPAGRSGPGRVRDTADRRSTGVAAPLVPPVHLARTGAGEDPRGDEQVVGQAVDVPAARLVHRLVRGEGDEPALGAAAYGAGDRAPRRLRRLRRAG